MKQIVRFWGPATEKDDAFPSLVRVHLVVSRMRWEIAERIENRKISFLPYLIMV